MPDWLVKKRYVKWGSIFGDAISYIYMGECVGFETLLVKWEKWEAEYAKRGYRTLPIGDFVGYGGYGMPLTDLGTKRQEGEAPVFHAKIYRQAYLGKIKPAVNLLELFKPDAKVQTGTYFLPSTKKTE